MNTVIVITMFDRIDSVYAGTDAMRDANPEFFSYIAGLIDDGAISGTCSVRPGLSFLVMRVRR